MQILYDIKNKVWLVKKIYDHNSRIFIQKILIPKIVCSYFNLIVNYELKHKNFFALIKTKSFIGLIAHEVRSKVPNERPDHVSRLSNQFLEREKIYHSSTSIAYIDSYRASVISVDLDVLI